MQSQEKMRFTAGTKKLIGTRAMPQKKPKKTLQIKFDGDVLNVTHLKRTMIDELADNVKHWQFADPCFTSFFKMLLNRGNPNLVQNWSVGLFETICVQEMRNAAQLLHSTDQQNRNEKRSGLSETLISIFIKFCRKLSWTDGDFFDLMALECYH